jgi:uncharacterized repeat protein (TIGR01451 family)
MKLSLTKFGLLTIGVALLMLAIASGGARPTVAASLANLTPTEPPTLTPKPTSTPTPGTPPAATPGPTKTPRPKHEKADPAITKSVNIGEAKIGDEVVFTISVTNNGPGTAEDVVVTDPIADYMDVIEATTTRGNVSSEGRTVIVTIGRVPAGDEITIRIRVRINERAQPPGGRNSVSLTTSSPGDDPSNNSSTVTFAIVVAGTPTMTPAATPTATATPATPIKLPTTGGADGPASSAPLFATLGLIAIGLSLLMRGKARR